jgi:hypothetical protein
MQIPVIQKMGVLKQTSRILIFLTTLFSLGLGIYFIWWSLDNYNLEVMEESGD